MQNEGQGKSSWWMMNHEARRAGWQVWQGLPQPVAFKIRQSIAVITIITIIIGKDPILWNQRLDLLRKGDLQML